MVDGERQGAWQARVAVAAALAVLLASACGRGVYHRVRKGETLYRISKAYGVPVDRLAEINRLRDASLIRAGQRLFIPKARRELPVSVITPRKASARIPRQDELPRDDAGGRFAWPVASGSVSSGFGPRGGSFHDGIDIAAPIGTDVIAAADGEVIYSDALPGYGNVVIIRHGSGYATVYAHNRENRAREGVRVRRGQQIATVGDTGRTTGPNLHFEVRRGNVARNPLYFLPSLIQVERERPGVGQGG